MIKMKTRISLSLDKKIVDMLDLFIDGINIRSRSDAVSKFLSEYLNDKRTVVILAGGEPKNLIIEELDVYRPLVKISKDKTLIENIIEKCRSAGYSNVIYIADPAVIAKTYEVLGNGNKLGVNINYLSEKSGFGSAKTLEKAKSFVKSDFLCLPCDHFFDFDLKQLRDTHYSNKNSIATFAVHARTIYGWNKTSIVEMEGSRIVSYEEKPEKLKSHLTSTFIGIFSPEVFNYIPPGEVYWSVQEHIFPKIAKEGRFYGYPIAGNWVNVHTKDDVLKVKKLVSQE